MSFRYSRLLGLALVALVAGCQKRTEPTPLPTQDQWRRVQASVLTERPAPAHLVDAVFDGKFKLIGWDLEPTELEAGKRFKMVLYWECIAPSDERWRIFVHLDSGASRHNIDHDAVGNLYPTTQWKPGDIVRDEFTSELPEGFADGEVQVYAGFFRDEVRLPVSAPGSGKVETDGRLLVGTTTAKWNAPTIDIVKTTTPITIDGRATERAWSFAPRSTVWVHPANGRSVEMGDTWAKMLWDDNNLYVLMNASDSDIWSTISTRDGDLWDEEVLEFYADAGNQGRNYLEFQINPLGTVFDAVFAGPRNRDLPAARAVDIAGMQTAVHVNGTTDNRTDTDRSWSAEMVIPLASLPSFGVVPPAEGTTMRVNFYRYDRPADGSVNTSAWSPVGGGSFHNPPRFGIAKFGPSRGPRTPEGSADEGSGSARMVPPLRLNRPAPTGAATGAAPTSARPAASSRTSDPSASGGN